MNREIQKLLQEELPLPKGTRIKTTICGFLTGETHELSESTLKSANKISEIFDDSRPFWCYGWRDLHDSLSILKTTEVR